MMSNRLLAVVLAGLFLSMPLSAAAQAARARASADVDLQARLKEVERDPKLLEAALKSGRAVASVCDYCHGAGGNSPTPDVPNLAAQIPVYHLEQLRQYASGQRKDPFMEGMIKVMNADEKVGMVLFYARQKVTPKPVTNPTLVAKGKELYKKACQSCHAENGHGDAELARIAGQQPVYLNRALKRYRTGTGVRLDAAMAKSMKPMSDADIDAMVAFMMAME